MKSDFDAGSGRVEGLEVTFSSQTWVGLRGDKR